MFFLNVMATTVLFMVLYTKQYAISFKGDYSGLSNFIPKTSNIVFLIFNETILGCVMFSVCFPHSMFRLYVSL